MKPKKPASPTKLIPEAPWDVHSPYGALLDVEGNPLERLESVHALLMKRDGITSMDAAILVFGPFLADSNSELGMQHGADKLRPFLVICDKADRAFSLFPAGKYADRSQLERLAELVPYVPHANFDSGTPEALLYAIAHMAAEVWAPHSGAFDLNDRPCAAFAEGYFPPVEKAREILGPLAVRHDLAHRLWDWGAVGAAEVDANAASAPPAEQPGSSTSDETIAPSEAQPPAFVFTSEFVSLCEARKGRKGDAWTDDEKATLYAERQRFPKRTSGLFDAMAHALGLDTAEAVRLKVREYKQAQDDARQAAANVTQVRGGKKVVNQ